MLTPCIWQTLGESEVKGGVIIYLTDGQFNCSISNPDDSVIDNPNIKGEIQKREIRVVTIAFG